MNSKERPIIMSGDNPKLILEERKTQTRRIVKPQPHEKYKKVSSCYSITLGRECRESNGCAMFQNEDGLGYEIRCKFGVAGDRLWVRETHLRHGRWAKNGFTKGRAGKRPRQRWKFKSTAGQPIHFLDEDYKACRDRTADAWHKRPSIHMPRWASRIMLEILNVRVERLQDISDRDAKAEGGPSTLCVLCNHPESQHKDFTGFQRHLFSPSNRLWYALLWDSLHGKGAWDKNPWVWVIEFKKANKGVLTDIHKIAVAAHNASPAPKKQQFIEQEDCMGNTRFRLVPPAAETQTPMGAVRKE